jgi:hypothetical protein
MVADKPTAEITTNMHSSFMIFMAGFLHFHGNID